MPLRTDTTDLDSYIKQKIIEQVTYNNTTNTQGLMLGVVVSNIDPLNINRIKVRIPKLDDSFYLNKTEEEGNNNLPWCLPFSRNFIGTPEEGSIVYVNFFNPKSPNIGRIFMDCLSDLNNEDEQFTVKRAVEEFKTFYNFNNAELATNATIPNKPTEKYQTKQNINYKVGIKGKGKNYVLLDKDSTTIIQNEGADESKLVMNTNIFFETSDEMRLRSKKGGTEYHPVFHKPLYDYINELNNLVKNIITVMNSVPSLSAGSGIPNVPSPEANKLIPKIAQLYQKFSQLKIDGNGHSKYLWIN